MGPCFPRGARAIHGGVSDVSLDVEVNFTMVGRSGFSRDRVVD